MNLRKRFDLIRRIFNLTMQLDGKTQELLAAHRRIRVLEQEQDSTDERDLIAAQARVADLTDDLAQANRRVRDAETKHKDAYDRVLALEKQLDAGLVTRATRARVDDQHRDVSALPPAHDHHRANAARLDAENADLRAEIERLKNGRNPS